MNTKQYNYPNYLNSDKVYLVRFQTDESDDTIDCWLDGFPTILKNARLPIYRAVKYDFQRADEVISHMLKNVFTFHGILSIMEYSDAAKIDSELREIAANREKESNQAIGGNQSQIDFTETTYPVCPYCGYLDRDSWKLPFVGIEDTTTSKCIGCEMEYQVERNISVSYSTQKLNHQPVIQNA